MFSCYEVIHLRNERKKINS